jgi:hypothetical protein
VVCPVDTPLVRPSFAVFISVLSTGDYYFIIWGLALFEQLVYSRHFRIWKFVSLLTEAFRWLQSHRSLLAIRCMHTIKLVLPHFCEVLIVNDEELVLAGQQGVSSYWIPCLYGSVSPTLLEKCSGITTGLAYL